MSKTRYVLQKMTLHEMPCNLRAVLVLYWIYYELSQPSYNRMIKGCDTFSPMSFATHPAFNRKKKNVFSERILLKTLIHLLDKRCVTKLTEVKVLQP